MAKENPKRKAEAKEPAYHPSKRAQTVKERQGIVPGHAETALVAPKKKRKPGAIPIPRPRRKPSVDYLWEVCTTMDTDAFKR